MSPDPSRNSVNHPAQTARLPRHSALDMREGECHERRTLLPRAGERPGLGVFTPGFWRCLVFSEDNCEGGVETKLCQGKRARGRPRDQLRPSSWELGKDRIGISGNPWRGQRCQRRGQVPAPRMPLRVSNIFPSKLNQLKALEHFLFQEPPRWSFVFLL